MNIMEKLIKLLETSRPEHGRITIDTPLMGVTPFIEIDRKQFPVGGPHFVTETGDIMLAHHSFDDCELGLIARRIPSQDMNGVVWFTAYIRALNSLPRITVGCEGLFRSSSVKVSSDDGQFYTALLLQSLQEELCIAFDTKEGVVRGRELRTSGLPPRWIAEHGSEEYGFEERCYTDRQKERIYIRCSYYSLEEGENLRILWGMAWGRITEEGYETMEAAYPASAES